MAKAPVKKKSEVLIYSTPSCPYCILTKQYLKENKIVFQDVDVSKDRKAAQDMVRKSGQMGVPVIDVNGKIIVGFDRPALKRVLKLKK